MTFALMSDIHANLHALTAVLKAIDREGVDSIYCLGDIVGYGGEPEACIELVRERASIIIQGNHDRAIGTGDGLSWFSAQARAAVEKTRSMLSNESRTFLATLPENYIADGNAFCHGALSDADQYLYPGPVLLRERETMIVRQVKMLFVGHTHVAFYSDSNSDTMFQRDGTINLSGPYIVLNPGSVGQPRDGNPDAAYVIIDTVANEAYFRRVAYDVRGASDAVRKAGMPERNAKRLLKGT